MGLYPIRCECGFDGDAFAKVAELVDGRVKCPECGRYAEQDYSRKRVGNGNREFRGARQVSLAEGWHPDEVRKVQREMVANGDVDAANCIDIDGRVWFKDRATQRKYMEAKARIWRKVAEGPAEAPSMEALIERRRAKREAARLAKAPKNPRAGRGRGNLRG